MSKRRGCWFISAVLFCALGVGTTQASTYIPNTHSDGSDATPGDDICAAANGKCTLRAAIEEANAHAGTDTVTVPSGTYRLKRDLGELLISEDATVNGGGPTTTRIVGNKPLGAQPGHRVFHVASGVTANITNMAIRRSGPSAGCGGGVLVDSGALVTLHNVEVSGNLASGGGAGICNAGSVSVEYATIKNNRAFNSSNGGGIENTGAVAVSESTFRGNRAEHGGGIDNSGGSVTVDTSTMTRNRSNQGAAINLAAATTVADITNSTFSHNMSGGPGGFVFNAGTSGAAVLNVTTFHNTSTSGGGFAGTTATKITNVILNRNLPTNCSAPGAVSSQGHNLDSGLSCGLAGAGDLTGSDPLLGPLVFNGGLTRTHALLAGSPAIDAGDSTACPYLDQRGLLRDANCDIGSFEYAALPPPTPTPLPTATPTTPPCNDSVQNGDETDVDCGGMVCAARCATGQMCLVAGDCTSGVCTGNICQAPTCTPPDGVKNGTETDIDCGGNVCPQCADGKMCAIGNDCTSLVCTGGICQTATCNDSTQNQDETDTDCGGTCGATCGLGQGCIGNGDCVSGNCSGNICAL